MSKPYAPPYTLTSAFVHRVAEICDAFGGMETALRLGPKDVRTHVLYSELLSGMGEFDLAFEHADQAVTVSQGVARMGIVLNLGRPRFMARQFDWVLDHYASFLKDNPGAWLAHFYRSLAFGAKGNFEEALAEAKLA